MFLLIYITVNIITVLLYTIAWMQAWRRLLHLSMPSSITLCYTPTHASNKCRLKSFASCTLCGRLAAPDFVMKLLRPGLFGGQKSGSSTGLLHYFTFGLEAANDAQNIRIDTAHGNYNDQQSLSTMIMWYCSVYNPNRFKCLKIQ